MRDGDMLNTTIWLPSKILENHLLKNDLNETNLNL